MNNKHSLQVLCVNKRVLYSHWRRSDLTVERSDLTVIQLASTSPYSSGLGRGGGRDLAEKTLMWYIHVRQDTGGWCNYTLDINLGQVHTPSICVICSDVETHWIPVYCPTVPRMPVIIKDFTTTVTCLRLTRNCLN